MQDGEKERGSSLSPLGGPEHGRKQERESEAADHLGGEVEPDAPVCMVERGERSVVDGEEVVGSRHAASTLSVIPHARMSR